MNIIITFVPIAMAEFTELYKIIRECDLNVIFPNEINKIKLNKLIADFSFLAQIIAAIFPFDLVNTSKWEKIFLQKPIII